MTVSLVLEKNILPKKLETYFATITYLVKRNRIWLYEVIEIDSTYKRKFGDILLN